MKLSTQLTPLNFPLVTCKVSHPERRVTETVHS